MTVRWDKVITSIIIAISIGVTYINYPAIAIGGIAYIVSYIKISQDIN